MLIVLALSTDKFGRCVLQTMCSNEDQKCCVLCHMKQEIHLSTLVETTHSSSSINACVMPCTCSQVGGTSSATANGANIAFQKSFCTVQSDLQST